MLESKIKKLVTNTTFICFYLKLFGKNKPLDLTITSAVTEEENEIIRVSGIPRLLDLLHAWLNLS